MSSSPLRELTNFILSNDRDRLDFMWENPDDSVLWADDDDRRGWYSMETLLRWEYEDFATDFCDFTDAVKKNTTITTIDVLLAGVVDRQCWRQGFWILNTLYRHLPNVSTFVANDGYDSIDSTTASPLDFLLRGTDRFENIEITSETGKLDVLRFQWGWLKPHAKLQRLEVKHFGSISLISMAEALAPLSNLKEVNITGCNLRATEETDIVWAIHNVGAITAFFQLSTLRTLELGDINFTNEEFTDLFAQSISESSIEKLKLHYKCSTAAQYTRMAEGIVHCRSLRELHLENKGRLDVDFPLLRLLRSHGGMTRLASRYFYQVPDEDLEELAYGMSQRTLGTSLVELSLSFLTPVHLCLILAAMRESTCLTEVNLRIDPVPLSEKILEGIDALRDALSLKQLSIRTKDFTSPPLDPVLDLELEKRLSQNFQLEHIDLPWLRGASHDRLRTICQLNEHGRSYLLSDNPSKAEGVNVLAKHGCVQLAKRGYLQLANHGCSNGNDTRQLDFLFTHLRENPGLCSRDDDAFADDSVNNASSGDASRRGKGRKRPFSVDGFAGG